MCMYVCVCVCVHPKVNNNLTDILEKGHTELENADIASRLTDRQTDRHTDRQTDRQIDR